MRPLPPFEPLESVNLVWRDCRFDELSLVELQYIYMARQTVFCIEQDCAYLDVDGYDEQSRHLAAWSSAAPMMPFAYARLVAPGVKYAEPSMGRVLTTGKARGTGLGRELVRRMIVSADRLYPAQGIRISAQSRLEAFYAGEGFRSVGEPYIEDGIPHIEMLRA